MQAYSLLLHSNITLYYYCEGLELPASMKVQNVYNSACVGFWMDGQLSSSMVVFVENDPRAPMVTHGALG